MRPEQRQLGSPLMSLHQRGLVSVRRRRACLSRDATLFDLAPPPVFCRDSGGTRTACERRGMVASEGDALTDGLVIGN
jgi:hypothetical protein